ncbi:hypothetical protein NQ317_006293 [Molorchus minor]|uniref:DDE Tnp4 domain-containing protein n=1 Tax=Molorchus minor TaxID=1323400 RepID=A0ABQ9JCU2_9CUCU|nr:hypothetical protein NQ317_006293 [Molorchus minor]
MTFVLLKTMIPKVINNIPKLVEIGELYLTIATPIASEGSAGSLLAILGDSTVREGELFVGSVLEPDPFFTYLDVGSNWYLGVSQSSVSRCITEVTDTLNNPADTYVSFPQNTEQLQNIRRNFYEKYNFPRVVGCIDCTYITIVPPVHDHPDYREYLYVNRKGYHSINVQFIGDNLKILNVIARYPGSTNDAFIWNSSNLQTLLRIICIILPNLCILHNVPDPEPEDENADFGLYDALRTEYNVVDPLGRVNPELAEGRRFKEPLLGIVLLEVCWLLVSRQADSSFFTELLPFTVVPNCIARDGLI